MLHLRIYSNNEEIIYIFYYYIDFAVLIPVWGQSYECQQCSLPLTKNTVCKISLRGNSLANFFHVVDSSYYTKNTYT